jgi:hypothetical protein
MGKLNSDVLTAAYAIVNKAKVETIDEFAERACDELRTGNIIIDKSIQDIIYNLANKMKEELK